MAIKICIIQRRLFHKQLINKEQVFSSQNPHNGIISSFFFKLSLTLKILTLTDENSYYTVDTMEVIQTRGEPCLSEGFNTLASDPNRPIPVNLSLLTMDGERANLLASIVSHLSAPRISIQANEFRSGPDPLAKDIFRKSLLRKLRE